MLRRLIEVRMLIALAIAAGVGTGGLRAFPIAERPGVSRGHRSQAPGCVLRARLWICRALVLHTVLDRVHDRLARHDRRLQDRPGRAVPRTASRTHSQRRGQRHRSCSAKHITQRDQAERQNLHG